MAETQKSLSLSFSVSYWTENSCCADVPEHRRIWCKLWVRSSGTILLTVLSISKHLLFGLRGCRSTRPRFCGSPRSAFKSLLKTRFYRTASVFTVEGFYFTSLSVLLHLLNLRPPFSFVIVFIGLFPLILLACSVFIGLIFIFCVLDVK